MATTDETERWHTETLTDEDETTMPAGTDAPDGNVDYDHDEPGDEDGMTGVLIDDDPQETDDG
jgi:hypothetical protein